MAGLIDLMGQRFGRLTVVSRAENSKQCQARWNCVCDCGGKTTTTGQHLRDGNTKSCGCLQRDIIGNASFKHGMTKTPTHRIWISIKQRCTNPKYIGYKNYGGRGITVCERWDKFDNFYEDMGERPDGMSIERKDNNGNYCPENCVYATSKDQNRNTRKNRMIKYEGKTQCLSAWAEDLGLTCGALLARLRNHPPQIAFNM